MSLSVLVDVNLRFESADTQYLTHFKNVESVIKKYWSWLLSLKYGENYDVLTCNTVIPRGGEIFNILLVW